MVLFSPLADSIPLISPNVIAVLLIFTLLTRAVKAASSKSVSGRSGCQPRADPLCLPQHLLNILVEKSAHQQCLLFNKLLFNYRTTLPVLGTIDTACGAKTLQIMVLFTQSLNFFRYSHTLGISLFLQISETGKVIHCRAQDFVAVCLQFVVHG